MLRITIHDNPESLTLQLEGRLAGPWVQAAEDCWRRASGRQGKPVQCFDLTGVTLIDAAGKKLLTEAHTEGMELVAAGCFMRAVVAEITHTPISHYGGHP